MVDVVVLAGSQNNGPLQNCAAVEYEALIPLRGRIMIEYVIATLRRCSLIGDVVVVGSTKHLTEPLSNYQIKVVEPGTTVMENVRIGLEHLSKSQQVLIVTSDIPLLTQEAVSDFLTRCQAVSADFYYPVVGKEDTHRKYPSVKRTYVKLKEGIFTGGNMFLVTSSVVSRCMEQAERMIALRKSPWRLCNLLGSRFLLKLLVHQLTISELEAKISNLFGLRAKAIIVPYPEIGFDVDKPSDLILADNEIKELTS